MEYLIAFYTGRKIYTLTIKPGASATIGNAQSDTLFIDRKELRPSHIVLSCDSGGVRILSQTPLKFGGEEVNNRVLSAGDVVYVTEKITLAVFSAKCQLNSAISLEGFDEISIGRSYNSNDICLKDSNVSTRHAVLKKINGNWTISDLQSRNGTFVNGELSQTDAEISAEKVNIFICGYVFYIQDNVLRFSNIPGEIEFSPEISDSLIPIPARQKAYPFFQRSPRIRSRAEKANFEISSPPNTGTKPTVSWITVILPPVMMVAVMGFVAMMTGNFNMLLYSVPMSMMSVVITVINNKNSIKKWMKNNGLAIEKYSEYLSQTDKEITDAEGKFVSSLSSANPGVIECLSIAQNVSRRLWERNSRDSDFLSVRLGTGTRESNVKIKLPNVQMSIEENLFTKQAEEIRDKHTVLTGIPVCHSLIDYPITGLSGGRDSVIHTTWRIIMDIATHHSYEDVKIICVYPEDERDKWEWLRWLPHIWDTKHKKRYLSFSRDEARSILREAAETMKVRRRDIKPGDRDVQPAMPFYILVLADRMLTEASGELFLPETAALGFAAVYAYGDIGSLPGECQSVIMCDSPSKIQSTDPARGSITTPFTPDKVSLDILDEFARALAPVRLMSAGGGSKMPSSVTFLQGFHAKTVQDLDVIGRWKSSHSEKSLAAPIGVKENGDIFEFDVFEKSMGPHGIAAGTSGSGKSEMLTTWLLSLALNFSPDDVNLALIEFKGNDLSNILHDLPHIAGIVSNLNDPSTIIRGLKSLKGEKDRRMRLFEQSDFLSSKSIFAYQKYQKAHPEAGLDPLPYLIIVIDEFAELVTQYPEFNEEIVSIARVGRSVGMYMTLTMQSPQGVVKGQVSSNTKFRVCLRTATASESKEIIGTDDAFNISAPGRAYVKVGNNEVYEQVQTFYAKAPYRPNSGQRSTVDEIKLVELNGTRTKPKNYSKTIKASRDEQSEGNMIVKNIIEEAAAHHIKHARPVWTEPLPEMLYLDELIHGHEAFDRDNKTWHEGDKGLAVIAGRIDAPEEQRQYPFVLDFMKNGHQILYGAPSTGKTSFLQTVILSAALSYTPEQVNFVILDYGSFILKVFEALPHCIIAADPTDEDKVKKAYEFLRNELASRRKLFSSEGVANLEAYREAVGKPVPAIIVVVDNIASLSNQSSDLMDVLNMTARDGGGLGIYLMIATGNSGGFLYKISQYVKSNHTLQMTDKTDYRPLVGGDGKMYPGNYPGRGLTKGALEYQTALCVESSSENDRSKKLKALCADMAESWTGKTASLEAAESELSAPIQADELSSNENSVQLGMRKGTRNPVEFVFSEMNGCVISGGQGAGKSSILGMIAKALSKDPDTALYVYEEKTFIENLCPGAKITHKPSEADTFIAELAKEYEQRDEDSKGRIVLCIDDFYNFYQDITQESADILEAIARGGSERKMYIYVAVSSKGLGQLSSWGVSLMKELLNGGNAVATGGSLKEYLAFKNLHREDNMMFGSHEGCIIHDGNVIPLMFGQP